MSPYAAEVEDRPISISYRFWEASRTAVAAIRAHKLRSFLTLLGIILSITVLVAVVSLISGVKRSIIGRISGLGSDVVVLMRFPVNMDETEFFRAIKRNRQISWEEYEYLRDHLQLPRRVGAQTSSSSTIRAHGRPPMESVSVTGVTANMAEISTVELASGRFISEIDDQHRSPVAYVGANVVEHFFPNVDPLGRTLLIRGVDYEIIGVATKKGTASSESRDSFVYVPIQNFLKVYGQNQNLTVEIQARSVEMVEETQAEVRWLFRGYRHLSSREADNFGITTAAALMELLNTLTKQVAGVMVGVVSIFLVVGGVVVMNVMLASVTERTLEIGIRRAAGATRFDIRLQFVSEAAFLTGLGGVFGLIAAAGLVGLLTVLTPLPMFIEPGAALGAIALSAGVGMFFGVYPAWKASEMSPIEALRWE